LPVIYAGAIYCMDDGITYKAKMEDGSKAGVGMLGKLMNEEKRMLSGD
jgi:hypothetical protein